MSDTEILGDLVQLLNGDVHKEIEDLTPEVLAWSAGKENDSIGFLAWGIVRTLDFALVETLGDREADAANWHPIRSYSGEGILKTPIQLYSSDILAYLDQVSVALRRRLLNISTEALYQSLSEIDPESTPYEWIKILVTDGFKQVGKIQVLKALHRE